MLDELMKVAKLIPGCDNYLATPCGQIISTISGVPRLLKPCLSVGYPRVNVVIDGKFRGERVHSLVCAAFWGPRPSPKHEVRHLDGTRTNNNSDNIRWGTRHENIADRIDHGCAHAGEDSVKAKLTEKEVKVIRKLCSMGGKHERIAEIFNISRTLVSYIRNRKVWKHVA